jgi:acetyltransferase-like isoleucine patch superfamily enzyme
MMRQFRSHGSGKFNQSQLAAIGDNVVFERGVLVFHPETITLGSNIYIGHNTILKGYHSGAMAIGDNSWIGQNCFFHSAGGIEIGRNVGIGPSVKIITSFHGEAGLGTPILFSPIEFARVEIGDDSDIGIGTIVLPGVRIGRGVQIGAGSLVSRDLPDYAVAYGSPAKVARYRDRGGG